MACDYRKGERPTIPDPIDFRAQATGVGSTLRDSKASGMWRSERIVANATPEQQQCLIRSGYPRPYPDGLALPLRRR